MGMRSWQGQRVVILGAARQGTALARYLVNKGASVVINDQRPLEMLEAAQQSLGDLPVEWVCGGHFYRVLDGADWLCVSGGVPLTLPLVQEALRRGILLSNDSQIFLEAAPCRVIGITGSAGKTTTTTLVGRIAQNASQLANNHGYPQKVWVGGNIGSPLISVLEEMQPNDLAVMELSSFQLEIMSCAPHVAAILNITPNHLDRHETMEAYTAAKARILGFQNPRISNFRCAAVLNNEDPGSWGLRENVHCKLWVFGHQGVINSSYEGVYLQEESLCLWDGEQEMVIMPRQAVMLRGEHNLLNVLAACAISAAADLPVEAMRKGVEGFCGVAHRLEFVRRWGGADWYNDSIATAPERSMAAIRSFSEPIILLAGGRDKDLPWQEFADLVHQRVDHLILFGEAASIIHGAVGAVLAGKKPHTVTTCFGLQEAIQAAAGLVEPGDVVLLSPGGTSFDEFRDFEARGEAYREWVHQLT
jgi:UDP-N-acetylmuramoylalanine--D-glutamate ligase